MFAVQTINILAMESVRPVLWNMESDVFVGQNPASGFRPSVDSRRPGGRLQSDD